MPTTITLDHVDDKAQALDLLLSWSDARDAEQRARLAATAAAYRAGLEDGEARGRRAVLEALTESQRQMHAELAGLATRPKFADLERRRWTLRGEARTRLTFADPHPGDYLGGPVAPWTAEAGQ
jgi:hypothetical protein